MSPSPNDTERSRGGIPAAGLEARREAALDRLTQAFASDLVTLADFETRVGLVQNARTYAELAGAMEGLEEAVAGRPAAQAAPPREGSRAPSASASRPANPVDPGIAGASSVACVMGDRTLDGDWLAGDKVSAFTCMGSMKLDLRDTALPPDRLTIDAFAFMGEIKIFVPRGLPVRLNVFPLMGEAKAAGPATRRVAPGMPYLQVSGFALMGSIVVVATD